MRSLIVVLLLFFGIGGIHASDTTVHIEMNQKTIKALIKNGSDPKKLHPLEHHFYSNNLSSLKALMKKGKSLGYKPANIGDNTYKGVHYWYGDLINEIPLNLNKINEVNILMLKLADEFKSDYDGWGTPIVE